MNLQSLTKIIPASTLLLAVCLVPFSADMVKAQGKPSWAGPSSNIFSSKELEKAGKEIIKAREEAFFVANLSQQVQSSQINNLNNLAQRLLNSATESYQNGNYFQARHQAKASKDTYKAIQSLQQAEIGYAVTSGRGGLSKSYFEAPYKVTEELAKAEAEATYYRSSNDSVRSLLSQARNLAQPASSAQPVANTDNFKYLAQNRAAVYLAKAARDLMKVERGF